MIHRSSVRPIACGYDAGRCNWTLQCLLHLLQHPQHYIIVDGVTTPVREEKMLNYFYLNVSVKHILFMHIISDRCFYSPPKRGNLPTAAIIIILTYYFLKNLKSVRNVFRT